MAGKGLFRMKRQMTSESDALSETGSKQSAWSKWGMGLGGLVAMSLTGGAATPLVAAMMAGGGTLAGGLLGRQGAKKGWFGTDKAKIEGGRFYRDEAAKWKKDIGSEIWSGAGKAALTAGMMKLGSGLSYGKEGLKAAIPGKSLTIGKGTATVAGEGFKMGDIVKRGAETATYGDSLMEKLGKAIDIRGSLAGKGVSKIGAMMDSRKLGKELQGMGEASLGGGPSFAKGTGKSFKEPLVQGPPELLDPDSFGGSHQPRVSRGRHAQFAQGEVSGKIGRMQAEEAASKLYNQQSNDNALSALLAERGDAMTNPPVVGEFGNLDNWDNELADMPWKHGGERISAYDLGKKQDMIMSEYLDRQPPKVPFDSFNIDEAIDRYDDPRLGSITMIDNGEAYPGDTGLWDSPPPKGADTIPEGFREGPKGRIQFRGEMGKTFGLSSTDGGYNFRSGDSSRHRDMLDSVRWHNRLFGD